MIGAVSGFNRNGDPVDTLFKAPKIDIELKAFVLSGFGVPVEKSAHYLDIWRA